MLSIRTQPRNPLVILSKKLVFLTMALSASFLPTLLVGLQTPRASASPDDLPSAVPGKGAAAVRPEDEPADFTILLSGREDGLMKPCGCTDPQMGGLERRAVLAAAARKGAKAFAAVSIGDTLKVAAGDRRQDGFKAELFRAALETLDYAGQLLGPDDLEGMVDALLTPYGTPKSTPRPPLNVLIKRGGPLALLAGVDPVVRFSMKGAAGELRVRAISVVDPTVRGRLVGYGSVEAVNSPASAVAALAKEPGLLIVAAHVSREDLAEIVAEATAKAELAIVVDVSGEVASKKPIRGWRFERGLLVTFEGHGKEVSLVRLRRTAKSFTADADAVLLEPEPYERPDRPEWKAVSALFEAYRHRVRDEKVLEQIGAFSDAKGQPTFVGSAACASCHPGIYDEWKTTPHARAMKTLEERDSAWDPECVVCHTVGWTQADKGGWGRRASSFATPKASAHLTDVGCENCHGPGSLHVEEPARKDLFGPSGVKWNDERMWRVPDADRCRTCHDYENSHGFNQPDGYKTYLETVDHRAVRTGRTVWTPPSDGTGGRPPVPARDPPAEPSAPLPGSGGPSKPNNPSPK